MGKMVVTLESHRASLRGTVGHTATLGWVDDEIAQSYMYHLLQRITPMLPSRGWYVELFKEFYPRGPSLLGLNVEQGREVCVRFRVPGSRNEFLPFHEVLCTTLHELAHCEVRRHDRKFWNLYYELVRECEALEVRLIAQGTPLYPAHLSTAPSRYGSARHMQQQERQKGSGAAVSAARPPRRASGRQGRATTTTTTPGEGTGHRLGGAALPVQLDKGRLRQLLSAAVTRRHGQAAVAEAASLDQPPTIASSQTSAAPCLPDATPSPTTPRGRGGWDCPRCGFVNSAANVFCAVCAEDSDDDSGDAPLTPLTQAAAARNAGLAWRPCSHPAHTTVKRARRESATMWHCIRCTFINAGEHDACTMCGEKQQPRRAESHVSVVGTSAAHPIEISDDEPQ